MHAALLAILFITQNIKGQTTLFIDNKAVIQTISRLHPHHSHHEVLHINSLVHTWLEMDITNSLTIVWVPSHLGFVLNKHADKSMKEAFIGPAPSRTVSLNSAIKEHKAKAVTAWRQQFSQFQNHKPLVLKRKRKPILPSAWNTASNHFLSALDNSPMLVSRFT